MAEIDRTSREATSRQTEQRVWRPAGLLPEFAPRKGQSYRWVSVAVMGDSDTRNSSQRFREGYTPVKAADYPELINDADKAGNVVVGGLMLCSMPLEMAEQRKQYFEQQTLAQQNAVRAQYMQHSNDKMPLFTEGKSEVKFGNGSSSS